MLILLVPFKKVFLERDSFLLSFFYSALHRDSLEGCYFCTLSERKNKVFEKVGS